MVNGRIGKVPSGLFFFLSLGGFFLRPDELLLGDGARRRIYRDRYFNESSPPLG